MPVPSYLVNLDRSPERLRHFVEQARSIGFSFERVAAIDGTNLARKQTEVLKPAEIGCFLSHRRAWQAFHGGGAPWGVIFEDDVRISPDFPAMMGTSDWIPSDADVVKIEGWPSRKVRVSREATAVAGRTLHRLQGLSLGAAGYMISRRAAALLLADRSEMLLPLDIYLFDPQSPIFERIVSYVLILALCTQERFLQGETRRPELQRSLIDRHLAQPKLSPIKKSRRELLRLISQAGQLLTYRRVVTWR